MARRTIWIALVALTIVPCRSVASACSLAPGYEVEPNRDAAARPANAELRYWHGYHGVVSFKLTDVKGRRVPARMIVTPIPAVAAKSLPIYNQKSFFTTLEPLEALTPGLYEMRVGGSRHSVSILASEDRDEPGAVTGLRARVITIPTIVGYRPDCQMTSEPRPFLELSFDGPREEDLLYDMTWSAATTPTRGLRAERSSDGRRVIRIPVEWFGDVSDNRSPSALDLRAVDPAGNRSRPTRVLLPGLPPLPPREGGLFPERPTPIPEQQAIDLARFARAAASDDARDALALLTAAEPSLGDSRYDTDFEKYILSRDHVVSLLATVHGGERRASLVVPVRIQAGRAAPVLSAGELRLLIASFPLQNQAVTGIALHVWHDRTVQIRVEEGGESRRLVWRPEDDPIGWAAEHGALTFVRQSIEAGGNVEGRARPDSLELTPLMRAARAGKADVVTFLLEHGANPNGKTKEGSTPLSIAANAGHAHVMRVLLDAGADPSIRHLGWLPLRHAAFNGRTDAVVLLLSRGVAPDAKVDNGGETALMIAAWRGHTETVKALLDRGADINARNDYGRTALMYATDHGKPEVVRTLLDRNPDLSARTREGRTAISSAIASGAVEAIQLLIEANADVNMPGENGELPLGQARQRPASPVSQRIVDLLIAAGARERR